MLEELESRNKVVERDVLRFREREKQLENVRLLDTSRFERC